MMPPVSSRRVLLALSVVLSVSTAMVLDDSVQMKQSATTPEIIPAPESCDDSTSKKAQMLCTAKSGASSERSLLPSDPVKTFYDFFKSEENRHILLTDDGYVEKVENPDPSLIEKFHQMSSTRMVLPDGLEEADIDIVRARGPGARFPGLAKFTTMLTYGSRLYLPPSRDSARGFPEYQMILLDSDIVASGPFAWIYKKLARGSQGGGGSKFVKTVSYTRVRVEPVETPEGPQFVFHSDASVNTSMTVPSWVFKASFSSQESLEARGSQSMQASLEKNIGPRLKRFRDAYNNHVGIM